MNTNEIKNKISKMLDDTENRCRQCFLNYKQSHDNLLSLYKACIILYNTYHKVSEAPIKMDIEFDMMSGPELDKLKFKQKNLIKKIEEMRNTLTKSNVIS